MDDPIALLSPFPDSRSNTARRPRPDMPNLNRNDNDARLPQGWFNHGHDAERRGDMDSEGTHDEDFSPTPQQRTECWNYIKSRDCCIMASIFLAMAQPYQAILSAIAAIDNGKLKVKSEGWSILEVADACGIYHTAYQRY